MPQTDGDWKVLAGDFPPTINREKNDTELEIGETPDAYQLDWDTQGLLSAIASEPTGDAVIRELITVPTALGGETLVNPMTYLYNRLWGILTLPSDQLRYGCKGYRDQFVAQHHGRIAFSDDTQPLLTFVPVDPQGMVVVKNSTAAESGSYYIPNAGNDTGKFTIIPFKQGFHASTASHVNSYADKAYCSNADGVFSYDGKDVAELTAPVRNDLGSFVAQPLLLDYDKNVIIGTGEYLIDLNNGKLFDYGTAGFLYTSPTLDNENKEPFAVQRIAFIIDHDSAAGGEIAFAVKLEEGDYGTSISLQVPYERDGYQRVEYDFDYEDIRTARQWRMKITSLPTNIRIKEIQVYSSDFQAQDYSE